MEHLLDHLRQTCRTYPGCKPGCDCGCGGDATEWFNADDVCRELDMPEFAGLMPACFHADGDPIISQREVLWLLAYPCRDIRFPKLVT